MQISEHAALEDVISLKGAGLKRTSLDFRRGAEIIGCDPLMLQAVFNVEAPEGGFRSDGIPTFLPEEHKIYRYATPAQRKELRRAGLASTTRWNKRQYKRFARFGGGAPGLPQGMPGRRADSGAPGHVLGVGPGHGL